MNSNKWYIPKGQTVNLEAPTMVNTHSSPIVRAYKYTIMAQLTRDISTAFAEYSKRRDATAKTILVDDVCQHMDILSSLNDMISNVETFVDWSCTLPRNTRDSYLDDVRTVVQDQCTVFRTFSDDSIIIASLKAKSEQIAIIMRLYCYETIEDDINDLIGITTDMDTDVDGETTITSLVDMTMEDSCMSILDLLN